MGDVEETVTTVEIDDETYEEIYKVELQIIGSLVAPYKYTSGMPGVARVLYISLKNSDR